MSVPTVVIIPTYNELENLPLIVGRVRAATPEVHVLVADDNSPDGTGALADTMAAEDDHIHVLHRPGKQGLGAAYKAGFAWAFDHGFERMVQMDADGSHQPEQLPAMLAKADEGYELVIGSRYIPGGKVENWPLHRLLLSRGGSAYSRIMLRLPVKDVTGGYRVFSARALRELNIDDVQSAGYNFQVDMLWHTQRAGLSITEVPITFIERVHGTSKMSGNIVFEAMWRVTRWGVQDRFGSKKTTPAAE
ncbi:polyprenol monophosphomannose synthase [Mycetocola spongiae]|uniref:polyprenol monophosphomannose synthase n=1 Tax=Mycetocola spongiae TaxID=2859226 RepID=UPI001CF337D6|nr:polyprenol monophosphomannose synthase [Mycetocola spongiae]UCR88155.1 polyprenol monophosphomannose synthase [Mycetocola spongiae]